MRGLPYWADARGRSGVFDTRPTAAEVVWEQKYGHRELRGNEVPAGAVALDGAAVADPTVPAKPAYMEGAILDSVMPTPYFRAPGAAPEL